MQLWHTGEQRTCKGEPAYWQIVWLDYEHWVMTGTHHAIVVLRPMSHLD